MPRDPLFTQDGAWRTPYISAELLSREEIRAGIERMQGLWDYFVQTAHPGTIQRVAAAKKDWRCNRCDRMNSAEVAFVASVAVAKDTPSRARHRVGQHHMCRLALAVTAPDWATCVRMFTRAQSSRPPNPRIVSSAGFFKRGAGR